MSDSGGRPRAADAHGAVRQAIQLHVDGRLEAAVDAYRAVLKTHAKEAACWSNLGVALRRLGRGDEGLEVLRQGARLCPASADLRHNLGNALADAGDLEGGRRRGLPARHV